MLPVTLSTDLTGLPIPQTELLQISRTNFSESFQILVHLKVLHSFVESVLRYGLPANYTGFVVKVSISRFRTFGCIWKLNAFLSLKRRQRNGFCQPYKVSSLTSVGGLTRAERTPSQHKLARKSPVNTKQYWSKNSSTSFSSKYRGSHSRIEAQHYIPHCNQLVNIPFGPRSSVQDRRTKRE